MFLRKLLGSQQQQQQQQHTQQQQAGGGSPEGGPVGGGMQTMSQSLQRRFARGVQYNSEYNISILHFSVLLSLCTFCTP